MSLHDWSYGSTVDMMANHAEHQHQGQSNATPHHHRFPRYHHRPIYHHKKHSISSGTLVKHVDTVTKPIDSPALDLSAYAKRQQRNYPTATVEEVDMLDPDRHRSRKERTFVGGSCAACELPLENKRGGEKVLQFSCGHLAHETCLMEYIDDDEDEQFCPTCDAPLGLDSARGGSILDLNKLSSIARSMAQSTEDTPPAQPSLSSSKTWDVSSAKDDDTSTIQQLNHAKTFSSDVTGLQFKSPMIGNRIGTSLHSRNNSDSSSSQLTDDEPEVGRKHDSDLAATEEQPAAQQLTRNIPQPKVTIRSEFPTLTRSQQTQSLTCLVTVEVPGHREHVHARKHPKSAPVLCSESARALDATAIDLKTRVDDWHGLDTDRFGPLRLHANLKVGRDGTNWQKLDCFLFSELLICVREKRATAHASINGKPKYQLKGSILIRKHLRDVQSTDDLTLTLNLVVATLPTCRLKFSSKEQLAVWRLALTQLDHVAPMVIGQDQESDTSSTEDEDRRPSSVGSSNYADSKSSAPTDYSDLVEQHVPADIHVPIDVVVVIPLSSSMQGLKIKLLKDALRFIITQLGEHDRMGLVTFGSNGGAIPIVGMAKKDWYGWRDVYRSIKPVGQKKLRADAVEGANVALDLLSQRTGANPISSIFLISDSPTHETEGMDAVVRRAHANKASVYSFGLGQTHKPDSLVELSTRTNASYVYVKEWKMLRECVAGCLGSLQSVSHLGAKLKLKIPEGSIAKFVKVSGALHHKKQASGREAEAVLGDLRFGDRRDILVQLSVEPDSSLSGVGPQDHWDSIVNGLASLGGSLSDQDARHLSVDEVPLIQADLSYGDLAKDGAIAHLSRPSLLTITVLPGAPKSKRVSRGSIVPPIPSHPSIVQRRMEMLTSDMLSRALTLVSKSQHESAHRLLSETRLILSGLGKGSLPPLPPKASGSPGHSRSSSALKESRGSPRPASRKEASPKPASFKEGSPKPASIKESKSNSGAERSASPRIGEPASGRNSPRVPEDANSSNRSLPLDSFPTPSSRLTSTTINTQVLHALDHDLEACLEFIDHPAVFSHDARKAALQTINVISSQRGYTFRTQTEAFWAERIKGIKKMGEVTKEWQMVGNDTLTETIAEQ